MTPRHPSPAPAATPEPPPSPPPPAIDRANPAANWSDGPAGAAGALVLLALTIGCLVWSATTRVPRHPRPPAWPSAPVPPDGIRLDPNSATGPELQLLPGIGPALAARIVADRTDRGPFPSVDGLARVRGIGDKTVERLRPHLRIRSPGSSP